MAEVKEIKNASGENVITVTASNGKLTYRSTEGYKNLNDARDNAINSAINILDHYSDRLNDEQIEKVFAFTHKLFKKGENE